jgi:hypothetical protein
MYGQDAYILEDYQAGERAAYNMYPRPNIQVPVYQPE